MTIAIAVLLTLVVGQLLPRLVRRLLERTGRLPRVRSTLLALWAPSPRRISVQPPESQLELASVPVGAPAADHLSSVRAGAITRPLPEASSDETVRLPAPANVPLGLSSRTSEAGELAKLPPRGDAVPRARLEGVTLRSVDALITDDAVVLGSDWDQADIVVAHESVTPRQCELIFRSDQWFLHNLDPSSITLVDGTPARPDGVFPLRDGSRLRLGLVELEFTTPSVPRAPLTFDAAHVTITGTRLRNEDSYLVTPSLVAVADGVGGLPAGEVASQLAMDVLRQMSADEALDHATTRINAAVREYGAGDPRATGLATTFDAAKLVSDTWGWRVVGVHVGDGVAISVGDNSTRVLTKPHTLGQLLDDGSIPNADQHPGRARLQRAIGLDEDIAVDKWSTYAADGDRFLLATDGLVNGLGMERLTGLLSVTRNDPPSATAQRLVAEAAEQDAALDNVTVVIADVRLS